MLDTGQVVGAIYIIFAGVRRLLLDGDGGRAGRLLPLLLHPGLQHPGLQEPRLLGHQLQTRSNVKNVKSLDKVDRINMHSEVLHQWPCHLGLAPHHGGLVSQHHAAAGGRYRAGRGHGQRRLGNRNPEDMKDRSYKLLIKS